MVLRDTTGDGIADVGPFDAQPPGSIAVPFNGFGRINVDLDVDTSVTLAGVRPAATK